MLQDWAMNTDAASLFLDGNSSAIVSKVCSPACIGGEGDSGSGCDSGGGGDSMGVVAGSFFGGLILGLVIAAAAAVVWYVTCDIYNYNKKPKIRVQQCSNIFHLQRNRELYKVEFRETEDQCVIT